MNVLSPRSHFHSEWRDVLGGELCRDAFPFNRDIVLDDSRRGLAGLRLPDINTGGQHHGLSIEF